MKPSTLHLVPKPAAEAPDVVALRLVAGGEVSALGDVYDRHAVALLRFATRAGGRQDAEDLVHETFVIAAKMAGTFEDRAKGARSWLYGIAARLLQERRRSRARFTRALLRLGDGSPSAHGASDSHRSDVERALGVLPEPKRIVFILAEIEGYSCEEIAEMLEIPVGTVWTRLHHARRGLRAFYEEVRDDPS